MSTVLAENKNSSVARQAAGLQLKNCLTARNAYLKMEYQQRWISLANDSRKRIREFLLTTLGTENVNPSCAAQCLACISAAELTYSESVSSSEHCYLNELLSELTSMFNEATYERRKEATIETIGFICQEVVST